MSLEEDRGDERGGQYVTTTRGDGGEELIEILAQGCPNLILCWQSHESKLKPAFNTLFGLVFQHVPAIVEGVGEIGGGLFGIHRGRLSCLHILGWGLLRWDGDGLLVRRQQNLKCSRKPECCSVSTQRANMSSSILLNGL